VEFIQTIMAEKILIVDDDVDSLKLIGLMLKRNGYEVTAADAGGKALAKAEAEIPDLIILDVMMPDMNGLEVCRRLRANPATADIPIIMFTAKTMIDDKVKGFEAGADDYLTKPTHPAELSSRVKSVLQRKGSKPAAPKPLSPAPKRGMFMAVLGVKGGVGTTTVALNLAAALLKSGEQPILAETRLGMGSMGLMLGADVDGVAKVVKAGGDLNSIQNALLTHQSGLRALVCSANPREVFTEMSAEQALALVQQLRTLGNPAIIDLGAGLAANHNLLLPEIDRLMYVVEANVVTLEMARQQLAVLDDIVGGAKISVVVVNRSQSTLPWHEAENRLNREVKAIISPAPELAFQSIESHNPMVLLQPNNMVSGQFVKLADELKSRIRSIANG
jgi:DNA-binding response OmpR family regulator